jgi:GTP:adenosylcobinamide-phosphate guanylyltransferase
MFIAIVLAGERKEKNDLLDYANVSFKSLIKINNKPMILMVLDALLKSNFVDKIYVIGPSLLLEESEELRELQKTNKITFFAQKETPATSILSLLTEIDDEKILITTSDNVLLRPEWVDYFCEKSLISNKDILMGVNDYKKVKEKYPESKRTVLKFKDISYCFCNLFAVMNDRGRYVINMWRKVETLRKKPLKIAKMFMPMWGLILFLLGLLTSKRAFKIMSKRVNAKVGVIELPDPEACIDVDKISDLVLVQKIISK